MRFWSLAGNAGSYVGYEEAKALQLALVELRARELIPDTVLFLEHEPVVTRGRGLQFTGATRPRHMPVPAPLPAGVAFAESERGGDLTYHGPGQLVIYPICKLDGRGFGPDHDIAGFLRGFERVLIDVLAGYGKGLKAESRESATGVWVKTRGPGRAERDGYKKIASMGIAVRRWVTYHGLAINCVNDLKPFHLISPCGFSPEVMTRLLDQLPVGSAEAVPLTDWAGRGRPDFEARVARRMGGEGSVVVTTTLGEAMEGLARIAAEAAPEARAEAGAGA